MKCNFCCPDKQDILYESKEVNIYIFPSCIKTGHFVVSPKRHSASFSDLNIDEIVDIFTSAQYIIKQMKNHIEFEKYYFAAIGDSGNHFHVHFLPKMKEDALLGAYVFEEHGWKGSLNSTQSHKDMLSFDMKIKNIIKGDKNE